jgi:hypothetical protein
MPNQTSSAVAAPANTVLDIIVAPNGAQALVAVFMSFHAVDTESAQSKAVSTLAEVIKECL